MSLTAGQWPRGGVVRWSVVTVSPDPPPPVSPGREAPAPLTVAVCVAALEAAVLIGYGLSLVVSMEQERLAMGASSLLFFVVYGGFLAFCAVRLYRLNSWARAPLVLAQLIQIMVGASFWGGSTTAIAVVAVGLALVALVGVFHPTSLAATEDAG
jgi:hypothetical protein